MTKNNSIIGIEDLYKSEAVKALQEAFGYKNINSIPKIEKVVVNVGVGSIHKESQLIEVIAQDLMTITGQKPLTVVSKKAIAGFKIRQGAPSGLKVTLRGHRMWDFLDRLLLVALPRTRDFQGLSESIVDTGGNINIGIKEHTIFPEIKPEKVSRVFSLQVTVVIAKSTQEATQILAKTLRFPIRKED
jgi:large subunit ribosomal protein L5